MQGPQLRKIAEGGSLAACTTHSGPGNQPVSSLKQIFEKELKQILCVCVWGAIQQTGYSPVEGQRSICLSHQLVVDQDLNFKPEIPKRIEGSIRNRRCDTGIYEHWLTSTQGRSSKQNYVRLERPCTAKEAQQSKETAYKWRKSLPATLQTGDSFKKSNQAIFFKTKKLICQSTNRIMK